MSKRILLVEDEEDNLTLLTHILRFLLGQHDLLIARDGREALLIAYEKRPDLILLDLTIPKLDGWE
jgi:CheY-like chemotaxis protein